MARSGSVTLVLLLVCAATAAAQRVWVYDTVTAVAIRPEFATTILKFVGTPNCAVDDRIFLADFTTCDFSFVENAVSPAKEAVVPVTCGKSCAAQWGVVTKGCYTQFRERMENDRRFSAEAIDFFAKCDKQVPVHTGTGVVGAASLDKPTGINVGAGADDVVQPKPTGTVSATDMDGAAAPAPSTEEGAGSPLTAPAGAPAGGDADTAGTPEEDDMATPEAEAGAEAPSADDMSVPAPAPGPSDAPTPAPAPAPEVAAAAPAPAPVSGASTATLWTAAAALMGAMMLLL